MTFRSTAALLAICFGLAPAQALAVEFDVDGYLRVEGHVYDSLSLDRDAELSEGSRTYLMHRLLVQPRLQLGANVAVHAQFDLFSGTVFGASSEGGPFPALRDADGAPVDTPQALNTAVTPGEDYRNNGVLRRAWAEVTTPYVDIRFGRMASHWGLGLMYNDGNCGECDYGDTVDRIQLSTSALRPVRMSLAFDTHIENFLNEDDDVWSLLFSLGYLGEVHAVGLMASWIREPGQGWNGLHGSLWGRTRLGPLSVALEADIMYGRGRNDTLGFEEMQVLAAGGALQAALDVYPFGAALEVGVASGDADPTDERIGTFTFDRDHNIALILFEQMMPVLLPANPTAENGNVDQTQIRTYDAVSNAFYLNIHGEYEFVPDLTVGVDFVSAWVLKTNDFLDQEKHYGAEVDVALNYRMFGRVNVGGVIGFFFPGNVFEERDFVFGANLRAQVEF